MAEAFAAPSVVFLRYHERRSPIPVRLRFESSCLRVRLTGAHGGNIRNNVKITPTTPLLCTRTTAGTFEHLLQAERHTCRRSAGCGRYTGRTHIFLVTVLPDSCMRRFGGTGMFPVTIATDQIIGAVFRFFSARPVAQSHIPCRSATRGSGLRGRRTLGAALPAFMPS